MCVRIHGVYKVCVWARYLDEVRLESDDDERHPQVRRQHARRQRRQTTYIGKGRGVREDWRQE